MSAFDAGFSGSPGVAASGGVVPVNPSVTDNLVSFSNAIGGQKDSGFKRVDLMTLHPRNASGFENAVQATDDSTPMLIQASATQTADLQQWVDFIGNTLLAVRANGDVSTFENNGVRFGISVTEKLSFWGATPIPQPTGANQAALTNSTGGAYDGVLVNVTTAAIADPVKVNANFTDVYTLLTAIRTALVDAGIMKGAA